LVQFFVCFRSSAETELFASSLLCCGIFALVLVGMIQRVTLCFSRAVVYYCTRCREVQI